MVGALVHEVAEVATENLAQRALVDPAFRDASTSGDRPGGLDQALVDLDGWLTTGHAATWPRATLLRGCPGPTAILSAVPARPV